MTPPRLTFIDPGSRLCGWCSGDGTTLPTAGVWRFAETGDNYGKMLHQLAQALAIHHEQYRPDAIAYEEPILLNGARWKDQRGVWQTRNDNLATLRKTIPLGARIEEFCYDHAIPCEEASCQALKTELAGRRHAAKPDMVAAALKVGMSLPPGPGREDAADAFAGWLLMLRAKSRLLSERFDKALWSARGTVLI